MLPIMSTPIRLAVVSTSRSEFGQLAPIVRQAMIDSRFQVRFAVGGMHHDSHTPVASECSGLTIERLPRPTDSLGLVHQVAVRDWLRAGDAECLLLLGDRFELLELAVPAVLSGVVIAHLSGGERTAGAIDDQIRDAVSKLAHLHFPAHEAAGRRLQDLAEDVGRICIAGEPGLDAIRAEGLMAPADLELGQGLEIVPTRADVVVAVHPVTRHPEQTEDILAAITAVVPSTGHRWFLSSPNGDPGSERIQAVWQALAQAHPGRCLPLSNRGARWFRSLTAACGIQIGNSSAGLVEAPSLGTVTIDVGTRQRGRPRGGSVITLETVTEHGLAAALQQAAHDPARRAAADPRHNPYGDGFTAIRVLDFLAAHVRDPQIRNK